MVPAIGSVVIRSMRSDGEIETLTGADLLTRMSVATRTKPLHLLALSGGGAGGAYGAGALVGSTRDGSRQSYDVVTGVSIGAFIAPFAFVGADWDDALEASYAGAKSRGLLRPIGVLGLLGTSFYQGKPLRRLVREFATDPLMAAVATEARKGRLSLVATTDLDRGIGVVWDMGSIAMQGSPAARELFREVLIASASVPGVFPPVMLRLCDRGTERHEMHVDGGVTMPFFIFPDMTTMSAGPAAALHGAHVDILVDRPMGLPQQLTLANTTSILLRSIDANMQQTLATHLELASATARNYAMSLRVSGVPAAYPFGGSFDFQAATVRPLFEFAYRCARADRLWLGNDLGLTDGRTVEPAHSSPGKLCAGADASTPSRFTASVWTAK
jgi:hypothetical protein